METSMIVNLSILGFLLLCFIIGLIKGLFKSVITIIVLAASVFIGSALSTPLTPTAVDKIYPFIEAKAIEIITEQGKDEVNKTLKLAEDMGVWDPDELLKKFTDENSDQIETSIKESISPTVRIILWVILGIISFIVLSIIGALIGKAINNTPGVKTVNRVLGGALGLLTGAAIVWGISYLIAAIGIDQKILTLTDNSTVLQFILNTIPQNAYGKFAVINIPIVGEIKLLELLGK